MRKKQNGLTWGKLLSHIEKMTKEQLNDIVGVDCGGDGRRERIDDVGFIDQEKMYLKLWNTCIGNKNEKT